MGHRALLAYRRDEDTDSTDATDDATYDLHRSHWGGADFALLRHVSAETPFAADTAFGVDPDPVATRLSLAEIVRDHLDFLHHEAFYRVCTDYEITAFHVLWFGLEIDSEAVPESETVGYGALVEARPEDADYLRGWFRGTKAAVGDALDRGGLTRDEATASLAESVASWADDREVIRPER